MEHAELKATMIIEKALKDLRGMVRHVLECRYRLTQHDSVGQKRGFLAALLMYY